MIRLQNKKEKLFHQPGKSHRLFFLGQSRRHIHRISRKKKRKIKKKDHVWRKIKFFFRPWKNSITHFSSCQRQNWRIWVWIGRPHIWSDLASSDILLFPYPKIRLTGKKLKKNEDVRESVKTYSDEKISKFYFDGLEEICGVKRRLS